MSVLESLTTLQESLLKRLPQLQAPASLHPLHVNPSTLISARNDLRGLLTSLSHTVTSFEDVAVTTRAVSTLRKWSEDFPSRPPHDLPRGNKRRRYAAAPPGLNAMETLEWLVQEVGGFESFRAEGVLTIGGKAIVVDVEPERGAVRMTYGMESKEAPWVVERLKENLTDSAALAVKLEALARLDALMAEVGETRDVFEELQGLMDRLYSLSEAFRYDCSAAANSLLRVGSPGLVITPPEPPWLSLIYDIAPGVDHRETWQDAVRDGFGSPSARMTLAGAPRLSVEPIAGSTTRYRAALEPPLVISRATGTALSCALGQTHISDALAVSGGSLKTLRGCDMESVLCPPLCYDAQASFEFVETASLRPQRYRLAQPSSLLGLQLDHFDFSTSQELEVAVQIIARQRRLNGLFTSCFGPRTLTTVRSDDPFTTLLSNVTQPKLAQLLDGTSRPTHLPISVSLSSSRLSLSLPSTSGHEIRLDINADYEVQVTGTKVDTEFLRRTLEVSRGCVPLMLVKAGCE